MLFLANIMRVQKSIQDGKYKRYKMQLLFRADSKEQILEFLKGLEGFEIATAISKTKYKKDLCMCSEYAIFNSKYYHINHWIADKYTKENFYNGWNRVLENNDPNDYNSVEISRTDTTIQYFTRYKNETKYYTFLNFDPKPIDLREVRYKDQEK